MKITLLALLLISIFPLLIAQAQESGESQSEEAIQEAPVVIQEPAYEYFYWPEEDLNNFGLSTMGEGKSGSTLGTSTGRTSNIEANEYLRNSKEARNKAKAQDEMKPESVKPTEQQDIYEAPQPASSKTPSGNPIYEWRDEDGNLHMTNELGKVPPEYQDQFFEENPGAPRQ